MKIIGTVEPVYTDEAGHVEDATYLGGAIVQLTIQEIKLLKMLDDAWKGHISTWLPDRRPITMDEVDMSNRFKAIRVFVETRYALNEFKAAISKLDGILIEAEQE